MNLYLLISAKKQIFLLFFSTSFVWIRSYSLYIFVYLIGEKKVGGKVTKFITSDNIFPDKNFNPILSNPNFFFPAYYVSFNLMSCDIDIISVDISIFDDLAIFVMSKDFLNWKWRVLWRDFLYAVTPLLCLAVNILEMLPIRKLEIILPCNIHITI